MKEEDKRAVALNSLTSIGKEYVTLSDSTIIGKDVLKDLKKLMELELREKYKVNKTKWRVITNPNMKGDGEGDSENVLSDTYNDITKIDTELVKKLKEKFDENQKKINKKVGEKNRLKESNKDDTDKYKRVEKEIKELNKFFVIDMVTDTPISFNTIVKLGENVNDGGVEKPAYCVPYIELNKDPKEIATILNDKKELDKIFREKKFKSFDDMVILDFYNEITKKLSDTKDYLRKTDPDIRQDIIDDLYNKLFALYDIKEYYFKNKDKDKEDIKEKYIKEKIRKNNNLSIGGGDNNDEVLGGGPKDMIKRVVDSPVLEGTSILSKELEKKPDDGVIKKAAKSVTKVLLPAAAATELAVKDIPRATLKSVGNVAENTGVGLYKLGRETAKAVRKVIEAPGEVTKIATNKLQEIQKNNKEKAAKFLEADKFLHIVTDNLKNKSKDDIDKELNIHLLHQLSASLNEKSIYKQSIDDLINIHDSISSFNREKLLKQEQEDAEEYIGKKKEASGDFILKAVEKYKSLKKSFVDKVNKDKDDVEKLLEEGAGDDFAKEISFEDIVNNNSGTYIKKLKNMNSYLHILENSRKPKGTKGGATPMYDVQKLKKDDGEQESSGNTPFDYYKKLKDNYVEIVSLYYKLVDDIGSEENHYNFIYDYDNLEIKNNVYTNTAKQDNEDSESQETLKEAYRFIHNKLIELINENKRMNLSASIFLNEGDPEYPRTRDVISKLLADIEDPKKKNLIDYKKKFNDKWKKFTGKTSDTGFFDKFDVAIDFIDTNCYGDDKCPNISSSLKLIFEVTTTKGENENKINELNEKNQLIENRIKLLQEIIPKLHKEFEKLYKVMKSMKGLAQATEYEEFVTKILKYHKIDFFEKDKDKHPIIKALNNEKDEREDQLKKMKSQREEAKKAIEDENAIKKAELIRNARIYKGGGVSINEKYKTDLKLDKNYLINKYKNLHNLIDNNNNNNDNLHYLMKSLKSDVEHLENDDYNNGSDKSQDVGREKGIYEDIWYDYNLAVGKKDNKQERWKDNLLYLIEGEKLHERVIQNNLDPEIILKINFRDKSIYIFLMFLIRTINIIALEFLIEYNIIKTIQYAIILYGFMYLFINSILIILVNYDSYKLRILFNYLNFHINSTNIVLNNILFIIFIILVYILLKSDDLLKYFGDLFDFTNIYNNIYKFSESINEDSDINLTHNEKLKLLYRIDIISMIIFMFSAVLVLIV